MKSSIKKNVISALSGSMFSAVLNFLMIPILIKSLGAEDYGKLAVLLSVQIAFFTLFNFQPWQAFIKFWFDDVKNRHLTICYTVMIDIIGSIVGALFLLIFLSSEFFNDYFFKIDLSSNILVCLSLFFNPYSFAIGLCRVNDKFMLISFLESVRSLIRFIGAIFIYYWGSIQEYLFFYFLSNLFVFSISYFYFRFDIARSFSFSFSFSFSKFQIEGKFFKFFKFSFFVTLKSIIDLPVQQLDKLLVSSVLGASSVAVYDVSKRINQGFSIFINVLNQVFYPKIASELSNGNAFLVWSKIRKYIFCILPIVLSLILGTFFIKDYMFIIYKSIFNLDYHSFIFSFYYTSIFLISSSFLLVHVFFQSSGYVKNDVYFLVFANAIYMIICFIGLSEAGLFSILIAYAIQVILVLLFKLLFIKSRLSTYG